MSTVVLMTLRESYLHWELQSLRARSTFVCRQWSMRASPVRCTHSSRVLSALHSALVNTSPGRIP